MVFLFFSILQSWSVFEEMCYERLWGGERLFYAKSTKNAVGSSLKLKSVGYEKMCQMSAVELI